MFSVTLVVDHRRLGCDFFFFSEGEKWTWFVLYVFKGFSLGQTEGSRYTAKCVGCALNYLLLKKDFPRERVFATLPEISLSCSAVLLHSVKRLIALKSRRDCYDRLV